MPSGKKVFQAISRASLNRSGWGATQDPATDMMSIDGENVASTKRLLIYPPKRARNPEKKILAAFFFIAAFFIGLFSLTRLFMIHWVWLVPVSVGSLATLMLAILYFRFREKPVQAIWLENSTLCLASLLASAEPLVLRFPLSEIQAESAGKGSIPREIRFRKGNELLLSCPIEQVRDVTLYEEIWHRFSPSPEVFSARLPAGKEKRGKFFWNVLPWVLIALLMAGWELYENHLAPRNYGPFSNP